MTFCILATQAVCLMAVVCWASNIWPGDNTWITAGVSRAIWWALPMGLIVWLNGAPTGNAAILAVAAWLGSWIPHVPVPRQNDHWAVALADACIVMLRVTVMLAFPAAIFWICGAFWPAMIWAAVSAAPCMQLAFKLPHGWPGFRNPQDVSGVAFGACVGFWLAAAVWIPSSAVDALP